MNPQQVLALVAQQLVMGNGPRRMVIATTVLFLCLASWQRAGGLDFPARSLQRLTLSSLRPNIRAMRAVIKNCPHHMVFLLSHIHTYHHKTICRAIVIQPRLTSIFIITLFRDNR
jgi:hypothetical protein